MVIEVGGVRVRLPGGDGSLVWVERRNRLRVAPLVSWHCAEVRDREIGEVDGWMYQPVGDGVDVGVRYSRRRLTASRHVGIVLAQHVCKWLSRVMGAAWNRWHSWLRLRLAARRWLVVLRSGLRWMVVVGR